jgi:hypothetical protein
MSSLINSITSYFTTLSMKNHKYETQADLKDMTPEQIVNIDPEDVGFYLKYKTGGVPLEGVKEEAMDALLLIKTLNYDISNETAKKNGRQRAINIFLNRKGIKSDPEVIQLMVDGQAEILKPQISNKVLENRMRVLAKEAPISNTEEEATFIRLNPDLKAGKRRTVSKGKRREKTRKGRKASGKTNKRRN